MPRKSLIKIFALALLSVAGLISANQFITHKLLLNQEDDALAINLAGRQRMLSQKIALNSYESLNDFSKFDLVRANAELFLNVHRGLQFGDSELGLSGHDSRVLTQLFRDVDQSVNIIVNLVRGVEDPSDLQAFNSMISDEVALFLPKMDAIVYQIQYESEAKVEHLSRVEILLTVITLIILVLQYLYIFKPTVKKLDTSHAKLKKLNLSKDRILATVAHDLRSPISGIKGLTNVLEEELQDNLKSEHKVMFNLMDDACDKSLNLIQELLEISVLESDEVRLQLEETHLREYLLNTISHFQDKAKEKGVDLSVDVQRDELNVQLDQQRFARVIDNLLTNALKFTNAPGKITLETAESNGAVVIKVKDSGIGIPKDMQQYIFDKFSKASRSGLQGEQSTGLGMSIVKQIVELHEGKIWLESEVNHGTEFFIELPKVA